MEIELLTKEDMEQFKKEINENIEALFTVTIRDRWLKSSEVKKLLNISTGTLNLMKLEGQLPFSKVGGLYFYKYRDIVDMLETNKRFVPMKKE
jgi:hypothetical protein